MTPPSRYSTSPLPSISTVYQPSFAELVRDIVRWLRRDPPSTAEWLRQTQTVERLAAEIGEDPPPANRLEAQQGEAPAGLGRPARPMKARKAKRPS
jgi:hypothetical protein